MYIVIDKDYKISKHKILSGKLYNLCRRGHVSVIDTKTMQGLNTYHYDENFGNMWSDIQDWTFEGEE